MPPYHDLGGKTPRRGRQRLRALESPRLRAWRHGRTIRVESAQIEEAASALRANGIELEWAPAPLFQERRVEGPLVVGTIGLGVVTVAATLFMLQNYYWAVVCGIAAPSLALFLVASNNP